MSAIRHAVRGFWQSCRQLSFSIAALAAVLGSPAEAADKVQISGLSDISFGTLTNFGVDAIRSQSICVFAKSSVDNYKVTATGSGAGGAFLLSSGSDKLPYEVQWSSASGQTTGTSLTAGVPLGAQHSTATRDICDKGPPTTASLIVVLRSAAISSAITGTYTGTLTLLIQPE